MGWKIDIYHNLEAVRDQWDYFFSTTPTSSLTMTWQYADLWWKHFGSTDSIPYVISVTDDMNHGLIMPLMKNGKNLSWLGAPDAASVSLLYNSSNKLPDAVHALGEHLRKTGWAKLVVHNLHSSQVDLMISALQPMQYQVHRETASPSLLMHEIQWAQYRELLPAKLRADLRRKYHQLEFEKRLVSFDHLRTPTLVDDYLPVIKEIARSEGRENICDDFLCELWRAYAACGWLELSLCYFDLTPVAYALSYTINGATSVVSSGSLAKFRDYAPDKLLMEHVIQNSFNRHDYIIDLLPEPEDYKRQWMDAYQPLSDITFYQNPLQQFIDGQEKLRRFLKV